MSTELEKILNLHVKNMNDSLGRLTGHVEVLFKKQEEMNLTLTRNTQIVEQHEQRSTQQEAISKHQTRTLGEMTLTLQTVGSELKRIDSDVQPMVLHVNRIQKILAFFEGVPLVLKVMFLILTIVTSSIGLFTLANSFVIKFIK